MKKLYVSILFCLINIFVLHAQTTITFTLDANGEDAAIDNYNTSGNYPNEIEYNTCAWTISGTPTIWRDLFKFNLRCIPSNATIVSAGLNLHYANTNSYGNAQHESLTSSNESVLQRVTSYWSENSVTWDNQPLETTLDQVILPQSTSGTQDYLNIDVKDMVQKMVSDPNGNLGFMLKLVNETYYARLIFASGDHPDASKHPSLEVAYTIPNEGCIVLRIDSMNEDLAIDDYNSGNNYPNEIEYNTCAWTISGTPTIWRNLFKFELPCGLESAYIQSAHLSLFYAPQNTYGNALHESLTSSNESVLQRVTSPWTEAGDSWNTQPTATSVNEVILQQSSSGTQDYTNMDVTGMVRLMQANTNQNYGFLLKLTNESYYARLIFASGDYPDTSRHPHLEICYTMNTAIDEVGNYNVVVFPNPFSDELSMTFQKRINDADFILYDAIGQKVFSKSNLSGDSFRFQNLNLASGLYFYEVRDGNVIVANGKVQKQM